MLSLLSYGEGRHYEKKDLRSLTWIKHITDRTPSICNAHAYHLVSLHAKNPHCNPGAEFPYFQRTH